MHSKRGQLSVFIILGAVILIIAVLFLFLRADKEKDVVREDLVPAEAAPVKLFVEKCMRSTLEDALYILGYQGGYIFFDDTNFFELRNYWSSFLYYEGVSNVPDKERIELELADYLEFNLDYCLDGFASFPGMEISGEIEKVDVSFTDRKIFFDVKHPLEIRRGVSVQKLSDFSTSFDIRFNYIYDTVKTIVDTAMIEEPYLVDFTYLMTRDLNVTAIGYNDNTIIYVIVDPTSSIRDEPYTFVFAVRVGPEHILSTEDVKLRIKAGRVYADMSVYPEEYDEQE